MLFFFRIQDTDCFLGIHDRKLYVLGICEAISLGGAKPNVLSELANEILPSLLLIFDGLKRAYTLRAQEGEEEESDEEDFDDDCSGKFFLQTSDNHLIIFDRLVKLIVSNIY